MSAQPATASSSKPHASLMIALTPHMPHLSRAVENDIDAQAAAHADAARHGSVESAMIADHSPSRVTFSVERRPAQFAPAGDATCTVNAEVVVRGVIPGTDGEKFEQLMWARRFKAGPATADGSTMQQHRVLTVEVPEEVFRYAERQAARAATSGSARRSGREAGAASSSRQQRANSTGGGSRGNNNSRQHSHRDANDDAAQHFAVAPVVARPGLAHPTQSDLWTREQIQHQLDSVDTLPPNCTFHLLCMLDIVRDTAHIDGEEEPTVLRRGLYETQIDPAALMANDSSLLPVEMFVPFVEESQAAVDVVAFASVFAVVGQQLAAATHGDDSNPSLLSAIMCTALAAQYNHLVFNVFRPELLLYRDGMHIALNSQQQQHERRMQQALRDRAQQPPVRRGGAGAASASASPPAQSNAHSSPGARRPAKAAPEYERHGDHARQQPQPHGANRRVHRDEVETDPPSDAPTDDFEAVQRQHDAERGRRHQLRAQQTQPPAQPSGDSHDHHHHNRHHHPSSQPYSNAHREAAERQRDLRAAAPPRRAGGPMALPFVAAATAANNTATAPRRDHYGYGADDDDDGDRDDRYGDGAGGHDDRTEEEEERSPSARGAALRRSANPEYAAPLHYHHHSPEFQPTDGNALLADLLRGNVSD